MRHTAIALLLFLSQQATPKPAFEVATVKANQSKSNDASWRVDPGGRFRAVNMPVFWLIAAAYATPQGPLRQSQIDGAPGWLESEHYDINAKAPDAVSLPIDATLVSMRPLLQSLLEDRFRLRAHFETRQLPVYALVLARPGGALGPRFGRSSFDCVKEAVKCGYKGGPGRVTGTAITTEVLMQLMALATDRVVVDRTGLTRINAWPRRSARHRSCRAADGGLKLEVRS